MKEDLKNFIELIKNDESIKIKLEEAGKNYEGEQTEEAAFNSIVVPIAKEAGYDISFDDMKQSIQEIDLDEMGQVSGGAKEEPAGGLGAILCVGLGIGGGIAAGPGGGGGCLIIGGGWNVTRCAIKGTSVDA